MNGLVRQRLRVAVASVLLGALVQGAPGFARADIWHADIAVEAVDRVEAAPETEPAAAPTAPAAPAASPLALALRPLLDTVAQGVGIDAALLEALVAVESNFNARAISRVGAVGLMQIMPATAIAAGLRGNRELLRRQLLDPQTNLRIGAAYLRQLLDHFSGQVDLALAAYNAGIGNVIKAGGRVPPNRETPGFVRKVSAHYAGMGATSPARPDSVAPSELSPSTETTRTSDVEMHLSASTEP